MKLDQCCLRYARGADAIPAQATGSRIHAASHRDDAGHHLEIDDSAMDPPLAVAPTRHAAHREACHR